MAEIKRTFKDSVFTCLFSEPKYTRELYLYLHPEDQDVTEEECRLITTENILAAGMYNDLGIQVRNRLRTCIHNRGMLDGRGFFLADKEIFRRRAVARQGKSTQYAGKKTGQTASNGCEYRF